MFSGRFDHAIDNKGRVSIPARFREVLQKAEFDRMFITNNMLDGQPYLELYPPDEWQRFLGRIKQKATFDRNIQLFQTFYIGGAHEVDVDRQGRILIPPKLRQFARLDKDVTFSATNNLFQLWDKSTLERVLAEAIKSIADPDFMKALGL